jgi:uncharacterized membrane protein
MRTRLFLLLATAVWCCLIIATPLLASGDGLFRASGTALYAFFSPMCHQWDSHSLHLAGEKFPVCIRCSAIYGGFFFGLLLYPSLGRMIERRFTSRAILAAAVAGMLVDVTFSMLGILESSTASRLLTGGTFGLLAAFVLTPVLHELIESFS